MNSMWSTTTLLQTTASKQDDDGLRASYNISLLIAEIVSFNNDDLLVYCQYLENLHSDFAERFQNILKLEIPDWLLDSFSNVNTAGSPQLEEELITNEEIKIKLKTRYQEFWLQKPPAIVPWIVVHRSTIFDNIPIIVCVCCGNVAN
ncbi:uncharacterized protein [Leptinotarsa decemlineata]|uniref:uncharacterized protein n=1 Tax=Leptinotarsa decemlineata TaxID=7539 RepID=UPI003D3052DE